MVAGCQRLRACNVPFSSSWPGVQLQEAPQQWLLHGAPRRTKHNKYYHTTTLPDTRQDSSIFHHPPSCCWLLIPTFPLCSSLVQFRFPTHNPIIPSCSVLHFDLSVIAFHSIPSHPIPPAIHPWSPPPTSPEGTTTPAARAATAASRAGQCTLPRPCICMATTMTTTLAVAPTKGAASTMATVT